MVYLYAALSVVMMTGIMSVFELGISLTSQSMLLKPHDSYQQSRLVDSVGRRDQQMLSLLYSQSDLDSMGRSLRSNELCNQLLCRVSLVGAAGCEGLNGVADDADKRLSNLRDLTQVGVFPPVAKWANACALQSSRHRLLIQPDPDPIDPKIPYRLFSCVLSVASICDFESSI